MNVIAEIQRINERELELGVPFEGSWHQKYRESAWVYVGGLPFELTEGDVLCVMSQFGEVEDVNLVRDVTTGKSKGFCFIKYENQRSTVLAVDNMNGARVLERVIRVDHVLQYKLPKEIRDREDAKDNAALSSDNEDDDDDPKVRLLYRLSMLVHAVGQSFLTGLLYCLMCCYVHTATTRLTRACVRRQGAGRQVRHLARPQRVCRTGRVQEGAQEAPERGEEAQEAGQEREGA